MNHEAAKRSVSYCGLVCSLCFLARECDGCRADHTCCERDRSDDGCFQRDCCRATGIEGCWQCDRLDTCVEGIYALGDLSKVKSFATCIRQDGLDSFVACVLANEASGLSVEKGRDYDGFPIAEVLRILRAGSSVAKRQDQVGASEPPSA